MEIKKSLGILCLAFLHTCMVFTQHKVSVQSKKVLTPSEGASHLKKCIKSKGTKEKKVSYHFLISSLITLLEFPQEIYDCFLFGECVNPKTLSSSLKDYFQKRKKLLSSYTSFFKPKIMQLLKYALLSIKDKRCLQTIEEIKSLLSNNIIKDFYTKRYKKDFLFSIMSDTEFKKKHRLSLLVRECLALSFAFIINMSLFNIIRNLTFDLKENDLRNSVITFLSDMRRRMFGYASCSEELLVAKFVELNQSYDFFKKLYPEPFLRAFDLSGVAFSNVSNF